MNLPPPATSAGPYEARYLAFIETTTTLRPSLHRYCARMTGSVLDGEDVVQEALFEAYRKLEQYDASRPLKPWLFRIAHHRCIDLLRKRGTRLEADTAGAGPDITTPDEASGVGVESALEHLVISLPPMERACVLLKDILGHSLEEIAALVDSTIGGVKAALHRGRAKIKASPAPRRLPAARDPELLRVLTLYVERFNRRDWAAMRELISADARLVLPDRYANRLQDSPYFSRYEQQPLPMRMELGEVDGAPTVIVLEPDGDSWRSRSPVRIAITDGLITAITDYFFCPCMLASGSSFPSAPIPTSS